MKEGSNQGLQYDMEWFGKLRTKHIAEIAIIYAREGNPSAVEIILKNCASLVAPYLLIILDNFPETLNPKEYRYIMLHFVQLAAIFSELHTIDLDKTSAFVLHVCFKAI